MLKMITACTALGMLSVVALQGSAQAQELQSQAKAWGLSEEVLSAFSAEVVDIACEIAGDCPANCGDGNRQLGLVDTSGKLLTVAKNAQAQFNGAVVDLLPYCGKQVDVDGLLTGHGGVQLFQVQFVRETGSEEWTSAKTWTQAWKAANPEVADGKGPWFRRDPRVVSRIEREGYLGLGLEEDARFIAEW